MIGINQTHAHTNTDTHINTHTHTKQTHNTHTHTHNHTLTNTHTHTPHTHTHTHNHTNTHQTLGLLCTIDNSVAQISNKQNTTLSTEKHPCHPTTFELLLFEFDRKLILYVSILFWTFYYLTLNGPPSLLESKMVGHL
jgi:hypothetical protein